MILALHWIFVLCDGLFTMVPNVILFVMAFVVISDAKIMQQWHWSENLLTFKGCLVTRNYNCAVVITVYRCNMVFGLIYLNSIAAVGTVWGDSTAAIKTAAKFAELPTAVAGRVSLKQKNC